MNSPRNIPDDHDRAMDCQEAVDMPLRELVDSMVVLGWKAPEVFDALEEVIKNERRAYDADPDPAEDPTL
jgi:hypothetical protein